MRAKGSEEAECECEVAGSEYEVDDEKYDEDGDEYTPTIPARVAFRRFWPLTRGLRGWLVIVWVGTVIAALAETEASLLFSDLTDHALARPRRQR